MYSVISILIVSPRRDRENCRNYVEGDIVSTIAWSSEIVFLIPGSKYRAAREPRHRDRIDRPVYPRSRRIGAPDKETPPLGLLPRAHRVRRRHHLRRIHNFARSLPNRLLALSLSSSRPFPVSLVPCVLAYQVRHEALSVPGGIDFDAQRRNLAQRRKKLVYLPLRSPYIAGGNFGPGCRTVLARKETTTRPAFSIPRSYGRIEVEEAPEWGRRWCS